MFAVFHTIISSIVYNLDKDEKFKMEIKRFFDNRKGKVEKTIFIPKKYFPSLLEECYGFDITIVNFNPRVLKVQVCF